MIPHTLSIAGIDPSGGAGLFADLKAFSALGAYGMGVVCALTAQNTRGVTGVVPVDPAFIALQLDTLCADVRVDAAKVGLLGSPAIASTVAAGLRRHRPAWVVVDPVMVAKSGDPLLPPEAVTALRQEVLPLADIITPNLPEAAVLLGRAAPTNVDEMRAAARALCALGPKWVLLKGGHLSGHESIDILDNGTQQWELHAPRIQTKNTHGTGCSLSAALTALLPQTDSLPTAVERAKAWLTEALRTSDQLQVGSGHGPVHHFHAMWSRGAVEPR